MRTLSRMIRYVGVAAHLHRVLKAREPAPVHLDVLRHMADSVCRSQAIDVELVGELPDGPAVVVGNHLSWLDPFMFGAVADVVPIGKSEVASWPIVGSVGSRAGIVFVERDSMAGRVRVLRRAIRLLRAGYKVLNFPEGTTTTGEMLPFMRGIFGAARIAGVPIVPIYLEYESPEMYWTGGAAFVPHWIKITRRRQTQVRLTVGPTIEATPDVSAQALASRAQSLIEVFHVAATPSRVHPPRADTVLSPARN